MTSMVKRFEGKIVYFPGGSTGIGRATAVAFGKENATMLMIVYKQYKWSVKPAAR